MTNKPCRRCGRSFPATDDFFRRSLNGNLTSPCKKCLHESRRQYRARKKGKTAIPRDHHQNFVACAICGDLFIQITGSHLAKHGTTMDRYKARFPESPTMSAGCRALMRENATEGWKNHHAKLSRIRKQTARRGTDHPNWKGGYEAGASGGSPKSRVRRQAIRHYGHQCMIPGCSFDIVVENHHIVPRAQGGKHRLENCILLCPNHHAMADAKIISQEELTAIVQHHLTQE